MRAVLEEIEGQAPEIFCGEAHVPEAPRAYVPTNFNGAHVGAERRFPVAWPKQPHVAFRWPQLSAQCRDGLGSLVPHLTHVGRAKSLVKAAISDAIPDGLEHWSPDASGEILLRVSHSGRLAELDAAFERGRRPPPPRLSGYTISQARAAAGPWRELIALHMDRPMALQNCVVATEALRAAVMSILGDDAPEAVHGHGEGGHVAWTPLPDVGHSFATGEFRGLGMWLPKDVKEADRISLLQTIRELERIRIRGKLIEVEFEVRPPLARQARTWTRSARTWASVTPVVADRVPKKGQSLVDSLLLSFKWAGYPAPVRIETSGYSAIAASPRAAEFRTREPKRLRTHVVVEFGTPVAGPVLVGAERFFGLGLFRPVQ